MSSLPLCDRYGRVHNYLRVSVTDRCNLRCRYCLPAEGMVFRPREEILSFDEIEVLAKLFVDLGIKKIRLTGGEPLVRKGIEDLCVRLGAIPGLEALALSTNGVMLEEKASVLKNVGVQHVNISLDTLRPDRFARISLRSNHNDVLRGIDEALRVGFRYVKINTVLMKGSNDDELLDFVEYAGAKGLCVRFIEYMPFLGNRWNAVQLMSYREMREVIESRYRLTPLRSNGIVGPAKEFRVEGSGATIGFITTMTEHFCDSCNRLRLTTDGRLRSCLFAREEVDLKRLVRAGASRDVLEAAIRSSVILKRAQHPEVDELMCTQDRPMVSIGG